MPLASPPFAAVLLAGGRSTRMGQDKAGLVLAGEPLWQRQLAKLRSVHPSELYISGHPGGPYAQAGIEIIPDTAPDLGPLAGIAAALRRAESSLLLVLAIDLPNIDADFLARILAPARRSKIGIVPWIGRHFEALAAIYPSAALTLAEECLRSDDRSMQRFVRRAGDDGLITPLPIAAAHLPLFRNLNRPEDLNP